MIICDTNILIDFYKNKPEIVQELRHIGKNKLAISVITEAELYFGALNKIELHKIRNHLLLLRRLPVDALVSDLFLQLMETYTLSHRLSIPDALIAATSLVHGLELYTLNLKDFRYIQGLNLYRPVTD